MIIFVVLTFNYFVSSERLKSEEEDDPSAETLSVVLMLLLSEPPRRITSPDWRPQHRWYLLCSTRVTDNLVKDEVPSNISQDLSGAGEPYPPQIILLQIGPLRLVCGRSSTGQECPVSGLKTSAELRSDPVYPPAIINPEQITFRTIEQYNILNIITRIINQ